MGRTGDKDLGNIQGGVRKGQVLKNVVVEVGGGVVTRGCCGDRGGDRVSNGRSCGGGGRGGSGSSGRLAGGGLDGCDCCGCGRDAGSCGCCDCVCRLRLNLCLHCNRNRCNRCCFAIGVGDNC